MEWYSKTQLMLFFFFFGLTMLLHEKCYHVKKNGNTEKSKQVNIAIHEQAPNRVIRIPINFSILSWVPFRYNSKHHLHTYGHYAEWVLSGFLEELICQVPNMAMTPPDSLSDTAVCLQITHPPNVISLETESFLVPCVKERRNGLDLQHKILKLAFNQIIVTSRQISLFAFISKQWQKKGFKV